MMESFIITYISSANYNVCLNNEARRWMNLINSKHALGSKEIYPATIVYPFFQWQYESKANISKRKIILKDVYKKLYLVNILKFVDEAYNTFSILL